MMRAINSGFTGWWILTLLTLALEISPGQDFLLVEGNKLHFERKGSGFPFMVFVTGLAGSLSDFDSTFNRVALVTTGVRYSRSGMGNSSYDRKGKSFDSIVGELDSFIKASNVPEPFVLVGHSYGGLIVRSYAKRYPKNVCGLLLIDPTFEDYFSILGQYESKAEEVERKEFESWLGADTSSAQHHEVESLWKVWHSRDQWTQWFEPLPDIPVFVLTSMEVSQGSLRTSEALMQARYSAHTRLVRKSPFGLQIGMTRAGHYLHEEDPETFMDAVRIMLRVSRQTK